MIRGRGGRLSPDPVIEIQLNQGRLAAPLHPSSGDGDAPTGRTDTRGVRKAGMSAVGPPWGVMASSSNFTMKGGAVLHRIAFTRVGDFWFS